MVENNYQTESETETFTQSADHRLFVPVRAALLFLPPAKKFAKVMLLQESVCPQGRGVACVVAPRGHAWLLWGACVVAPGGGMHGCSGGHAWLLLGGHAWDTTRYGDTINERAVRILLECILV